MVLQLPWPAEGFLWLNKGLSLYSVAHGLSQGPMSTRLYVGSFENGRVEIWSTKYPRLRDSQRQILVVLLL